MTTLPDWYVEPLKDEIRHLEKLLRPLESGKFHVGDSFGSRTQAQITALRHSIAEIQHLVDGDY